MMSLRENNQIIKGFFTEMFTIRETERALLSLFSQGRIRGTVHTCIGQEAIAVGLVGALNNKIDVVCSNHRGHGHYLSFTGDYKGLIAEIMGLDSGMCQGIGGSQHIHATNYYSNGILGGMPPIACGIALSMKLRGENGVSVVFFGDGAMGEGNIYEAFNLAGTLELPVLFAVELNQYAQSTPTYRQHSGTLHDRSQPFGIEASVIDGNDIFKVREVSSKVIEQIRIDRKPRAIFMNTYRLASHSKGDDDRDPAEISTMFETCPINRIKTYLDDDWCSNIETEVQESIGLIIDKLDDY